MYILSSNKYTSKTRITAKLAYIILALTPHKYFIN